MTTAPARELSVVVATRDRAGRLARLLDSLAAQTVGREAFEVVVVDDGSADATTRLLAREQARGRLDLRVLRHERSGGPAVARDAGWRAARGRIIAFTDDDCVVAPHWLEAGRAALDDHGEAIVQGRTDPMPGEVHHLSPLARTIVIHGAGPQFETANIFYARASLERLDGFDRALSICGEDTDLAWRALDLGLPAVYAPEAQAYHAVQRVGAVGMARYAWHWHGTVGVYARHRARARRTLHLGVFWSVRHRHILQALAAAPLARRRPLLAAALAAPYVRRVTWRRSGPLLAPVIVLCDLVEVAAILRGALRHRVLVL